MMLDYRKEEFSPQNLQYDVCIVGAGPAGIGLALSLASSNLNIILIESGGEIQDAETQNLASGKNLGLDYFPLAATRLRNLGGSSAHWSGWCAPLDPYDMEHKEWIKDSGWPIQYSELLKHYPQAQKLLGLGPYNYQFESFEDHFTGHPKLDQNKLTLGMFHFSDPPVNVWNEHKKQLLEQQNLTIVSYANATQINLNPNGDVVQSITLNSVNGNTDTVESKVFILACGGIENPRLMLASNSVLSKGVGNGNDLVGRFFMEHIEAECGRLTEFDGAVMQRLKKSRNESSNTIGTIFSTTENYQKSSKIGNGALFFDAPRFEDQGTGWSALLDLRDRVSGQPTTYTIAESLKLILSDFDTAVGVATLRAMGKEVSTRISSKGTLEFVSLSEQTPNPDSRVTLSDTLDKFGHPLANLDWQINELDRKTIRETALALSVELLRTRIGKLQISEWLRDEEFSGWPEDLHGGYHHMGTTRMSADHRTGIVDTNCKVHNVENLYVSGSSVFPTGGYANPTLTIMALTVRLGEYLQTKL